MDIELLKKYNMQTLEEYKLIFGDTVDTEITFYKTFLIQTDYIPNKLIESQIMMVNCDDYSKELKARQFCREQINNLQVKEGKQCQHL